MTLQTVFTVINLPQLLDKVNNQFCLSVKKTLSWYTEHTFFLIQEYFLKT